MVGARGLSRLSLCLILSFCLCFSLPLSVSVFLSPPLLLTLTLIFETSLKSWGPTYFYLNCSCLFRKTEFNQNISVARSRWPVQVILNWFTQRIILNQYIFHVTHAYSFAQDRTTLRKKYTHYIRHSWRTHVTLWTIVTNPTRRKLI